MLDAAGAITYVNGAVERALGHRRERPARRRCVEVRAPCGPASSRSTRLAMLVHDEQTPTTTLRLLRADGTIGWWEVTAGTVLDPAAGGQRPHVSGGDGAARERDRCRHTRHPPALRLRPRPVGSRPRRARVPRAPAARSASEIAAMLEADMVYVDQLDVPRAPPRQPRVLRPPGVRIARDRRRRGPSTSTLLPDYLDGLAAPHPVVRARPVAVRRALGAREAGLPRRRAEHDGDRDERSGGAVRLSSACRCSTRSRVWSDDEVTFLRVVAETIAHVLERARLDDALRASETRFRLLSETAADVVVLVDARRNDHATCRPRRHAARAARPSS